MNPLESLNEYMNKVFDTNGDGSVTVKEIFYRLSHSAPALALLVVDLLVIAAEIRVWDIGMEMTGSGWKAIGFVLVSAVPFYLAQILWIYPRGNIWQKAIGLLVGLGGLSSSAIFGRADLLFGYDLQMDTPYLLGLVITLTVAYVIALLVFVVIDPTIRAWFIKIQTEARVKQQQEYLALVRSSMLALQKTKKLQKDIEDEFDDPTAVQSMLDRYNGKKQPKQMTVAYAKDAEAEKLQEKNPPTGRG